MADRQRHTVHCQRTSIAAELDVLPISNAAAAVAESPAGPRRLAATPFFEAPVGQSFAVCPRFREALRSPSPRSLVPARGAARCLTYDRPAVASHHALERFRRHDGMEYPLGRFPLPTALPARPTLSRDGQSVRASIAWRYVQQVDGPGSKPTVDPLAVVVSGPNPLECCLSLCSVRKIDKPRGYYGRREWEAAYFSNGLIEHQEQSDSLQSGFAMLCS